MGWPTCVLCGSARWMQRFNGDGRGLRCGNDHPAGLSWPDGVPIPPEQAEEVAALRAEIAAGRLEVQPPAPA